MSAGDRYSRQTRFPPFGSEGQRRLGGSSVLLVGVGALGTSLADTLVRAGVGRIWLVDRDIVELSNLQRQLLYTEDDVDRPKAVAAAEHLRRINSDVDVRPLAEDFGPDVYGDLEAKPDLILDGTDNFATRFLINDLALRDGVPWIYGGVVGSKGTAMVILPGVTPCIRCLMPIPPATGETETCETAGVLAPVVASGSLRPWNASTHRSCHRSSASTRARIAPVSTNPLATTLAPNPLLHCASGFFRTRGSSTANRSYCLRGSAVKARLGGLFVFRAAISAEPLPDDAIEKFRHAGFFAACHVAQSGLQIRIDTPTIDGCFHALRCSA